MATTSWAAIRGNMTSVVKALSPLTMEDKRFDRAPRRYQLRKWVTTVGSGCFRKFEIRRTGKTPKPLVHPPGQCQRNETAVLTVAYPCLPALYGSEDLDSMEDVVREDAQQIYVALVSPVNYLSGQHCASIDIEQPTVIAGSDGLEKVWLQPLTISLIYDEAT